MQHLSLIPAYGRDYTSKAAVIADWDAGKDFYVTGFSGSGYINKPDAKNVASVAIRYSKLAKVVIIDCEGEGE